MVNLRLPTVRNFFCYFDLTTGGLTLGCFDAIVYVITLITLLVNYIAGKKLVTSGDIDEFSLIGLTIDSIVQIILLFLLTLIAVAFIKGVKGRSPRLCLPFVILSGVQSVVFILEGIKSFNSFWLLIGGLKIYFFLVVYSLYQLFTYGDEQAAYEAHQNANSAGYEQYYEPDDRRSEINEMGYQTTEFKGP